MVRSAAHCAASVAFVLVAGLSTAGLGAAGTYPGPEGQIAFAVSEVDGERTFRLCTMTPGDDAAYLVANLPDFPGPLQWSPDGSRIALTYGRNSGSIAPFGDRNIAVVQPDGTGFRQLTHNSSRQGGSTSPTWSPDGKRIAFVHNLDEVWVMNADGSDARHLAGPLPDLYYNGALTRRIDSVNWSPDGTTLLIVEEPLTDEDGRVDDEHLNTVRADGTELRRWIADGDSASWAPDAKRIAFLSPTPESKLWTARPDGSDVTKVPIPGSHHYTGHRFPVWSPQGDEFAVFSRHQPASRVAGLRLDGTESRELVPMWFGSLPYLDWGTAPAGVHGKRLCPAPNHPRQVDPAMQRRLRAMTFEFGQTLRRAGWAKLARSRALRFPLRTPIAGTLRIQLKATTKSAFWKSRLPVRLADKTVRVGTTRRRVSLPLTRRGRAKLATRDGERRKLVYVTMTFAEPDPYGVWRDSHRRIHKVCREPTGSNC